MAKPFPMPGVRMFGRKVFRTKQSLEGWASFHAEGFVNEYTLDSVSPDGKALEFITVRIENIAQGWRAKEAYRIVSADEVVEMFSLAPPGKEFAVYSETHLKRVK
jgi:hypothetical protein